LLSSEQLTRLTRTNIRAVVGSHQSLVIRALPAFAMAGLIAAGSVAAAHHGFALQARGAAGFAHVARLSGNSPVADDVAPSPMRQAVQDRRAAGLPLPSVAVVALEDQNRQKSLDLQQQQAVNSQQAQDLAQLNQTVQANQATLADLAKQLGLPQDRLAPAAASLAAIGGFAGIDRAALPTGDVAPAPAGGLVTSVQDLTNLVTQYLNLPCPLPADDPRCAQAAEHARAELWRGHGLDSDRPDATPILNITDVAQGFGPTAVTLEPLETVDGQLVHFHDGIDLPADQGEPVMAAGSGTVVFADVLPSGAETVEIAHAGGYHSLYLHESQLLVTVGQHVQKGQIIGLVGTTGMSTGPHVHFTVQDPSGKAIDPTPFIGPLPEVDNFAPDMYPPPPVLAPVRVAVRAPVIARAPVRAPVRAAPAPVRRR
jgi:murein DD-endopeptidase MepM/ murein hydrolase activator NlpD